MCSSRGQVLGKILGNFSNCWKNPKAIWKTFAIMWLWKFGDECVTKWHNSSVTTGRIHAAKRERNYQRRRWSVDFATRWKQYPGCCPSGAAQIDAINKEYRDRVKVAIVHFVLQSNSYKRTKRIAANEEINYDNRFGSPGSVCET